jgi:hypothetical protein
VGRQLFLRPADLPGGAAEAAEGLRKIPL